jgi:hypothetical protein
MYLNTFLLLYSNKNGTKVSKDKLQLIFKYIVEGLVIGLCAYYVPVYFKSSFE